MIYVSTYPMIVVSGCLESEQLHHGYHNYIEPESDDVPKP